MDALLWGGKTSARADEARAERAQERVEWGECEKVQ